MAPRKHTEVETGPLASLVLADNVHFKGDVFLKGSAVSDLPVALQAHVSRNPDLGVAPE